jgi:hypothetical protein
MPHITCTLGIFTADMGKHLRTVSQGQNDFDIRVLFEDFWEEGTGGVVHSAPVP